MDDIRKLLNLHHEQLATNNAIRGMQVTINAITYKVNDIQGRQVEIQRTDGHSAGSGWYNIESFKVFTSSDTALLSIAASLVDSIYELRQAIVDKHIKYRDKSCSIQHTAMDQAFIVEIPYRSSSWHRWVSLEELLEVGVTQ